MNKIIAFIRKETMLCDAITILEELPPSSETHDAMEAPSLDCLYRKYDKEKAQWSEEKFEPQIENKEPETKPVSIESVHKEIEELKEQQKKDSLMLLRTVLDSVEEILNKNNETTGGPKGESI